MTIILTRFMYIIEDINLNSKLPTIRLRCTQEAKPQNEDIDMPNRLSVWNKHCMKFTILFSQTVPESFYIEMLTA